MDSVAKSDPASQPANFFKILSLFLFLFKLLLFFMIVWIFPMLELKGALDKYNIYRPAKCPTFWGTVPHSDNKKSPEICDVLHFVILLTVFCYACHFGVPHSKVGCPTFWDSEVGRSASIFLYLILQRILNQSNTEIFSWFCQCVFIL